MFIRRNKEEDIIEVCKLDKVERTIKFEEERIVIDVRLGRDIEIREGDVFLLTLKGDTPFKMSDRKYLGVFAKYDTQEQFLYIKTGGRIQEKDCWSEALRFEDIIDIVPLEFQGWY